MSGFISKHGSEMLACTLDHLKLCVLAILIASSIAVPLGVLISKSNRRRLVAMVLASAGLIQTIPSLALLALIVTLFGLLKFTGLNMIGFGPALVALVLYALLPILRNTYTGIRQLDLAMLEIARGMGMSEKQILYRIELPLAMPVIMAGVRISAVWTIGVATLCSLVGAGGLGDLILRGLRTMQPDYLIAGILPAVTLALCADYGLGRLETHLTPQGLRPAHPDR